MNKEQEQQTEKEVICKNCGFRYGRHSWLLHRCPIGETSDGEYRDTKFEPDSNFITEDQNQHSKKYMIWCFEILNICQDDRLTSSEKIDEIKAKYTIKKRS